VRIGKVVSLSILEIPPAVQQALGALPEGGRLLSADECHLLMVRLDLYSLNPALPIWVYRVRQLDGFRFSERLDLVDSGSPPAA
jgi:hypothetical protein